MSLFSGIWVALVTPFQPIGQAGKAGHAPPPVDHAALRRLVRRYQAAGVWP